MSQAIEDASAVRTAIDDEHRTKQPSHAEPKQVSQECQHQQHAGNYEQAE
jgi:hypothetical protein